MRVLVSPTAFKGTLSPVQASQGIAAVIKKRQPSWDIIQCPVADGGDGTLDVLSSVLKAKKKKTYVTGPLGGKVLAEWAVAGKTAIVEMARASGLALVKNKNRIMDATTYGTGELIQAALNLGCRKILIGVGGAATGDGGAGALRALGMNLKDETGRPLLGSPNDLIRIKSVDWKRLDPRLRDTKIYVVCDVTNPLLGANGSARTFGPQKGATKKQVDEIERALRHWSSFARFQKKKSAGAGAAGALAYGLSAFLGAKLVKGSPFVFQALNWKAKARRANIIIAGEGQVDRTSFSGKTIGEIVRNNLKVRLFLICGRNRLTSRQLQSKKIAGIWELGPQGLRNPKRELKKATEKLLARISGKW